MAASVCADAGTLKRRHNRSGNETLASPPNRDQGEPELAAQADPSFPQPYCQTVFFETRGILRAAEFHRARDACQIRLNTYVVQACCFRQGAHLIRLALPQFENRGASRSQKTGQRPDQRAIGIQPIGPAIQGAARLVALYFRHQAIDFGT